MAVQPKARAERLAEIMTLASQGLTTVEIARELGCSRSTVQNARNDPDGAKQKARRARYQSPCPQCGRPMDGSGGFKSAPLRCGRCENQSGDRRKWTREVVIDAIRRFAAIHGRPPIADEWIKADRDHGYPPRSAMYRSTSRSSALFASWADAIEAAGFPRPTSGRRTYTKEAAMDSRNGYVVLREQDDGVWEVVGENDQPSQMQALNAAMDGHKPEGRWLAVPARYWRPRSLKPRTIYDFVEDTA